MRLAQKKPHLLSWERNKENHNPGLGIFHYTYIKTTPCEKGENIYVYTHTKHTNVPPAVLPKELTLQETATAWKEAIFQI